MRRLQGEASYSADCGALIFLIFLIFLASQGSTLAQNVAPPVAPPVEGTSTPDCTRDRSAPLLTDAAVKLSPLRGWQMEGREIEVTITSNSLPTEAKPIVCFGWEVTDGKTKFVSADTVRIVQQSPASQQPPKPPTLTLAVAAPPINSLGDPRLIQVEKTPYDQFAPVAALRILMPDRNGKLLDVMTTVAIVAAQDYCNVPIGPGVQIDSGTIVPSTFKNWQPVFGEIQFTAKTPKMFPSDALIRVCFRWKLTKGEDFVYSDSGPIRILDRQPSVLELAVGVPDIWGKQPCNFARWQCNDETKIGSYAIWGLAVPEADLRVLVFDKDLNPVFDKEGRMGITSIRLAAMLAILVSAIAFASLWVVGRRRYPGIRNPLLCVITTRRGFASLSQFQIMLWTFVILASAVYVIALSGDLIPITSGSLVLLGISGTATIAAKAKGESDAAAKPPPMDPAAAAAQIARTEDAAEKARQIADRAFGDAKDKAQLAVKEAEAAAQAARADAEVADANALASKARAAVADAAAGEKKDKEQEAQRAEEQAASKRKAAAIAAAMAPLRHPRWSDLVMEEIQGRELDVTRIQMLFFTLVTAAFVVIKVITSYEIPEIPEGFLILMGISNSVYVGAKFAAKPAAKT